MDQGLFRNQRKDPILGRSFQESIAGSISSPETQSRHLFQGRPPREMLPNPPDSRRPFYTLGSAFSGLDLSSSPSRQMSVFPNQTIGGDIGHSNSSIGGQNFLPPSLSRIEEIDLSLQRLRIEDAVNGYMGSGGAHRYQTSFLNSAAGSIEPQRGNGCVVNHGYEFDGRYDLSFLHRKKQLTTQSNTQLPILLCSSSIDSSRNNFDELLDDFVTHNSNMRRPNMYNDGLHPLPQSYNYLSLEDWRGKIVSLAKDQSGSRFLQMKFHSPTESEIKMVLSEVVDYAGDLMKNQFGRYLIQKLVAVCNEEQRTWVILSLTKIPFQLIALCLNPIGSRSVQKLLEHLSCPEQISLIMSALSPGAVALANDPHGHHIIQFCIENFSYEDNERLLNEMVDNCFAIATDKNGCCVLQSCMEHCHGKHRDCLVSQILANAVQLAEDPYGNYVLQHLLGLRMPLVTKALCRQLRGSFALLSCNKYGSNVVEKCLIESTEKQSTGIIVELLQSPNASVLLVDPFGNFVIQSALSVSKGNVQKALLDFVQLNAPSMRSNLYGKKVLAWVDKKKLQQV